MTPYLYLDAEFNDDLVLCIVARTASGEEAVFDTRDGDGAAVAAYLNARSDHVLVAFNCDAEMSALARLGVDPKPFRWIDLMVEANMVTSTYAPRATGRKGLVPVLEAFEVPRRDFDKSGMYDLILSRTEFTDEEFAEIVDYCRSDVEPLPALHGRIQYHLLRVIPYGKLAFKPQHAIERGEYVKDCWALSWRSKGLPIDTEYLGEIAANLQDIRNEIIEDCNAHYGHDLYVWNHVTREYHESLANFEAFVRARGLEKAWQKTETGRFTTKSDYLDHFVKRHSFLLKLRYTRETLAQTKKFELPNLVRDGYVKPVSLPYYTKTGRNQPLVSRGFVLNMAPWLRFTIRPEPGWVLIAADWSSQEIAIAAALTGDPDFLAAYLTGDTYLALAKKAGAVPAHGTKASHGKERQAYKSVQLGLGYGMGRDSLAISLFNDLNEGHATQQITWAEAVIKANEIYRWHKKTFKQYWKWLREQADRAKQDGGTRSPDDWLYFVDDDTHDTQLLNFPIQATAAVMLRRAIHTLARETDLDVVCSLHDAIYILCREEDAEAHTATLVAHMTRAVTATIGAAVPIKVDTKAYTHEEGYTDPRGTETVREIKGLLARLRESPRPEYRPVPHHRWKEPRKRLRKTTRVHYYDANVVSHGETFTLADLSDEIGAPIRDLPSDIHYRDPEELRNEIAFHLKIDPAHVHVDLSTLT